MSSRAYSFKAKFNDEDDEFGEWTGSSVQNTKAFHSTPDFLNSGSSGCPANENYSNNFNSTSDYFGASASAAQKRGDYDTLFSPKSQKDDSDFKFRSPHKSEPPARNSTCDFGEYNEPYRFSYSEGKRKGLESYRGNYSDRQASPVRRQSTGYQHSSQSQSYQGERRSTQQKSAKIPDTPFSNVSDVFLNVFSKGAAAGGGLASNVKGFVSKFAEGSGKDLVNKFNEGFKKHQDKKDLMGCTFSGLSALYETLSGVSDVTIGDRRFQVLKTIGEGGYAFVYLVREVTDGSRSSSGSGFDDEGDDSRYSFALKKVLIQSPEHMKMVKNEIEAASKLDHPNLLPLLAHAIRDGGAGGKGDKEALLLFPVYKQGTLSDHLAWMVLPRQEQTERRGDRFTPLLVLHIFKQICLGLSHMHSLSPPLAHNDLKLGNVLLKGKGSNISVAIMDFGSASKARKSIRSRNEALSLQEWAEQNCTAPYRAPEFWDCPSQVDIDERTDVWSLGCTLYALMYGQSPFEYSLGESGGSLQLAIMSGTVKWPSTPIHQPPYPKVFHDLVLWMLQADLTSRPFVTEVIGRVENMIAKQAP